MAGGLSKPRAHSFKPEELRELLEELGKRLAAQGVVSDAYIVGGYAMAVQVQSRRLTEDIDGWFGEFRSVKAEADRLAVERGIPEDWLNEHVAAFISFDPDTDDPDALAIEIDGFRLRIASPRVLLAMKIAAGRPKDAADIRRLIRALHIRDPEQVVEIAFSVFGEDSMTLVDTRESVHLQAREAIRAAYLETDHAGPS